MSDPNTADPQKKPEPPAASQPVAQPTGEIGGTSGQEPTVFGDWQHAGRCSDF